MGEQPRQWPIIAKRAKIAKDPRLARNRANKEQTGKRRVGAFVTLFSSPRSCFFLQKIKEERLRTYTYKDVSLNLWPIAEAVVNQTQNLSFALSLSEEGPSSLQLFSGCPQPPTAIAWGHPSRLKPMP